MKRVKCIYAGEALALLPPGGKALRQERSSGMDTAFAGTPSDVCPPILATGTTDAHLVSLSLSRREAVGRDAEYLAWHTMDHRPEQYRISGLRHSLRVVSTPECRAARAASVAEYDDVDHVVAYMFTGPEPIPASINSTWRWSTMADSSRSCRPWDLWLANARDGSPHHAL